MTHPITPPTELVEQWEKQFLERPTINGCFIQSYIAAKAAQWGADQELEACCEWVDWKWSGIKNRELRAARRPKPPTLKEQALAILATAGGPDYPTQMTVLNTDEHILIKRALEALPQ
jgi:hypothetical protein